MPPTFAEMFETRLERSSPDARRFLETLAICGRPMAPELICDACGVARERQSLVAMLRSSHFIRSSGSSERIETYHDRIREVLAAQMAPDAVRRIHGLIVQALVERQSDDCEALFEHYRGAGDPENASIQAGLAAAKASDRARLRSGRVLLPARAAADRRPQPAPARGGKDSPTRSPTPAARPRPRRRTCSAAAAAGPVAASRAPAARRRAIPDRRAHRSRSGFDPHRARGRRHAVVPEARAARWSRCCGGAHGFGGADCTSCRGPPATSTRMPSFASTPAGRRRPACCWWT